MLRVNHSMIWDVTLTSDASRSWGCGAFTATGEWFQFQWPQSEVQIMVKELAAVVLGVAI